MTEEQLNKKALDVYPDSTGYILKSIREQENFDQTLRREGYIKAFKEIEELPKIKGWVARDGDGSVHYFEVKPERSYHGNYWWDRDYIQMSFEKDYFPELRWEDEPVEVELLIRRI